MYATVMMPKIAPGISLSMLYCASRVPSLTSVCSIEMPANLSVVVDAFILISPVTFDSLGQRDERADDVSERDQTEHDAGQFAEQTVLREPGSCGCFRGFVGVGDHSEGCFVGVCVHFQVLPLSCLTVGKASQVPAQKLSI